VIWKILAGLKELLSKIRVSIKTRFDKTLDKKIEEEFMPLVARDVSFTHYETYRELKKKQEMMLKEKKLL